MAPIYPISSFFITTTRTIVQIKNDIYDEITTSAILKIFLCLTTIALLLKVKKTRGHAVPDAPYPIPVLGHSLAFSRHPAKFSSELKNKSDTVPRRLKLVLMDIIYLTKAEDIAFMFRNSTQLTNGPYRKFVSSTFGVPKYFQEFFAADNSGLSSKPHPNSTVKPEHRVDYLMHKLIVQFMTGASLKPLAERFTVNMATNLQELPIGNVEDLYNLIQENMFHASVEAMFGKSFFQVNPHFSKDFWAFEVGVPDLAKGLPRLFFQQYYNARDACIASVEKWHRALELHREGVSKSSIPDNDEYDDVFGSPIVKKRHQAFAKMEIMGSDAKASEDLALIWGSNSNAVHATFWLVFEILRDSQLCSRFLEAIQRAEVRSDCDRPGFKRYDLQVLCAEPFLQSLYAETLRLYVTNIVLRSPAHNPLRIRDWVIHPGEIMAMMSYPMHHDESKYNTGRVQDPHPLSEFWADRFLVPDDSAEGSGMKFSLKGLDGSWIPYGGGSNTCPGRHFAKQEMLLTAALLIGNFEIKLMGTSPQIDERFFGTGVLGVKGAQPCRIRQRE